MIRAFALRMSAVVLLGLLTAGCASEPTSDVSGSPEVTNTSASAVTVSEPPSTTTGESVDIDVPPEPDPDASAAAHPDFEWAFERGYYEASCGRTDYYEPNAVGDQGSFAGLAAKKAYRDGFAKGLADYQENRAAQESSAQAASESEAADGIIGETLPGYDPKMAVLELWGLQEMESCTSAAAVDPCVDLRNNADNDVVVVARLTPDDGSGPDTALLLGPTARGYRVLDHWSDAEQPGTSMPEWAL